MRKFLTFLFLLSCAMPLLHAQEESEEAPTEDNVMPKQRSKVDVYFFVYPKPKIDKTSRLDSLSTSKWRHIAKNYIDNNMYDKAQEAYLNFINTKEPTNVNDLYNFIETQRNLGYHKDIAPYMSRIKEKRPGDLRVKSFEETRWELKRMQSQNDEYRISNLKMNKGSRNDLCINYFKMDKKTELVFLCTSPLKPGLFQSFGGSKVPKLKLETARVLPDLELTKIKKYKPEFEGKWNMGTPSFAKGGKLMAFTDYEYGEETEDGITRTKIYFSEYKKKKWQEPEAFPFDSDSFSVAHPCLNRRGNIMYFTSDMPGGYGGSDIYVSHKIGKNLWSTPMNLGDKINTEGNEMFPFFDETTGHLFFSSDGHNGLGGLDVYEAEQKDSCICSYVVTNLGAPVNSVSDDYAFVFNRKHTHGYFSSNRVEGTGGEDAYKFIYVRKKLPTEVPIKDVDLKKGKNKDNDRSKGKKGNNEIDNKNDSNGTGVTIDYKLLVLNDITKRPILNAEMKIKDSVVTTDEDGEAIIPLKQNTKYFVDISAVGYKPISKNINITDEDKGDTVYMKIATDENIVLKNIYYDFDKADILPESAKELDRLVTFLKDNPTLDVELSSHTDSRGDDDYNMRLSQKRAKAAVDYVISKGISPKRITGKGYGETRLKNKCANGVECTEEQHRENRRTEIYIPKFGKAQDVKQTKGEE